MKTVKIRKRYEDAASVAGQMMNCYTNKRQLTTRDLVMPGNATSGYELINYGTNIRAVDGSIFYTYYYKTK